MAARGDGPPPPRLPHRSYAVKTPLALSRLGALTLLRNLDATEMRATDSRSSPNETSSRSVTGQRRIVFSAKVDLVNAHVQPAIGIVFSAKVDLVNAHVQPAIGIVFSAKVDLVNAHVQPAIGIEFLAKMDLVIACVLSPFAHFSPECWIKYISDVFLIQRKLLESNFETS
ncbi:hypothetical protein MRX96_040266 [Rhipicephalus microplus]